MPVKSLSRVSFSTWGNITMPNNMILYFRIGLNNLDSHCDQTMILRLCIGKIITALTLKGLTMIPTRVFLRDGWAKIEIAIARGKKKHDRRADLAKRDAQRQVERALREKFK